MAEGKQSTILLEAEAKRKARVMMGEADEKYAKMVGSTQAGLSLAQMEIQKDSLKGLGKVAYVPHLPKLLDDMALQVNVNSTDLMSK
mmetsp:Transcript_13046/g.21720  ORF Transcript_13046/g.21720 Transcript_13046/m.21720 type:complete len:87 (+) Transcript_13046:1578-1838(+)